MKSLIIAFLFFLMVSCSVGPESIAPPHISTPAASPVAVNAPVYGLLNLSNPEITLLLTKNCSYLFSAANNNTVPPSELMCTTEEVFEEFSDTLTDQTLNFNCSNTHTNNQSIIAELEGDSINLKYIDGSEHDHTIELADIIKPESPNFFKIIGGDYVTRISDCSLIAWLKLSKNKKEV